MPIRLDERLSAIAGRIKCGTVADVGCDHGKLGLYLLQTDRARRVIATDISLPSLNKARELARENGVSELMETRPGDGLSPVLSGEADVVVIAGMGGDVISRILSSSQEDGKIFPSFLLSPNTHAEKVRKQLALMYHTITADSLTECAGKYYNILLSQYDECAARAKSAEQLTQTQLLFGKFYKEDEVFFKRGNEELSSMKSVLSEHYSPELDAKIKQLERALDEVKL